MPHMLSRLRGARWWLAGAALLLLIATIAGLLIARGRQGSLLNPGVEFRPQSPQAPAPSRGSRFDWPVYGYTKERTQYLPLQQPFRPPFAQRWAIHGSTLLEFTPALGGRSLFLLKNNGALYAVVRKTGKKRWKRKLGYLAASAPAYDSGTVYAVLLLRYKGASGGRIVAVSSKDGRTRWSRKLASRSESSPLVAGGSVYFGSENGTVYALRATNGSVVWRYRASGAVKGGVAMDDQGRLFFGDYSGHVQALRARDGKLLWRKGTNGTAFGLGSGNFYATPAVAFGRVYLGNTDGNVYSYAADTGALAWRRHTGGYVYASAAVAKVPGGQPTVYVGSYDGTFYALDARTGRVRWSRAAEGKISGGITILGDLVFYSTLNHHTTALNARTGARVWTTPRGAFNPVVSDGRGIFLNGWTSLYGLDGRPPRHEIVSKRRAARRVAARRRAIHRRLALRRRGVRFCFRSHGHRLCRLPRPLVCFRSHGKTVCHPTRPPRPAAHRRRHRGG
jgi:outer membrane protein assembly factor BamB